MIWIIGAVLIIVIFVAVITGVKRNASNAIARFELPLDSDKEFFEDPATGKRYDKKAYEQYLDSLGRHMQDAQLRALLNQRSEKTDIWNRMLCDALRAEIERRLAEQNRDADEEDEDLEEETDINDEIAPFFWVDQETGASVGLETGNYLQDVFASRADEGFTGSGYDWNSLARVFIQEEKSGLRGKLQFDSQEDLFSVYSKNTSALKEFIYAFREACEDHDKILNLFSRAKKPE